jgi:hypothetical protein
VIAALLVVEVGDHGHVQADLAEHVEAGSPVRIDADTAEIVGKGAVTLRRNGRSVRIESGTTVPIDVLRAGPVDTPATHPGDTQLPHLPAPGSDLGLTPGPSQSGKQAGAKRPESTAPVDSLAAATASHESAFTAALAARDADAAVAAILELESAIVDWSRDTLQSDEIGRARAALRSMIVRLGAAATEGVRDVREVLGPVVEAALAARVIARSEKAFAVSDAIRDELAKAGIEVRDTPDGVDWLVAD